MTAIYTERALAKFGQALADPTLQLFRPGEESVVLLGLVENVVGA
jgi:hypothetical protein